MPSAAANALIRREATGSAIGNAVINAAINAYMLRGSSSHLLTVDSITAREATIFGAAVPMAVSLGFIVGTITFFTFRKKALKLGLAPADRLARPYFFFGFGQVLTSALVMFGLVVSIGVLWQRAFGSLAVSTPVAATLTGLVAGAAGWASTTRTARALLRED